MGKGNRRAKDKLIALYGDKCMFASARIAERIEQMGGIRTYKSYVAEKKFKGKKISTQLTYHHLKHRSEGGPATVENGAVIAVTAHEYLHSLPRKQEEIINDMLRKYKLNALAFSSEGVQAHATIELDTADYISIPVYDNKPQKDKRRFDKEKTRLEPANRAKLKRETQKALDKYYEGDER